MIRIGLIFALTAFAAPLAAEEPVLGLPIDCTLGETCNIQQYVDRDPGPAHSDFACGGLTYDGHKGTDFALPTLAAMHAGVDVLAAADGVITGTRNDMPDVLQGTAGAPDVTSKECGNGIVIKHDDGWETQYCHLKQGSIIVNRGQKVSKGDVLGLVGLSGQTEFPHVHLSLRKNGAVIDPFDADETLTCNDSNLHSLWQTDIGYVPAGLIDLGFSNSVPKYTAIKAGKAHSAGLQSNAPALVFWGYAFGGQQGDVMELVIEGPNGEVIRHRADLEKPQAQFFRAAGKRTKPEGWPAGTYTGTASLVRGAEVLGQRAISVEIN